MRRFSVVMALSCMVPLVPLGSALAGSAPRSVQVMSDFNGDGFADLAVGVYFEGVGDHVQVGGVNVLYGSPGGLQATDPADQFWSQDSPDVEGGAENGDFFGESLAAGDFNGDGRADLAVGVPGEDIGPVVDAGGVNVLYGSPGGLQATAPADQFWSQDSPGVNGRAERFDSFGFSVAAGDFDGDGFSDLAIGAPNEGVREAPGAGAINVLYGSAGGLQATSPDDQVWHQDIPSVKGAAEGGDTFGRFLAAGDFNGSGHDDLAIGVPLEDVGVVEAAGAVNVLYGQAFGLQAIFPDDQLWHQDSPNVEDAAEQFDLFGSALASADFSGEGFHDLAIASSLEDVGAAEDAGGVNVLYGSASGLQTGGPASLADQFWTQDSPDVEDQAETFDLFGSGQSGGDFNGDSFADLAIGVELEDVNTVSDAGAVNVLYGSLAGLQTAAPADQFWHQDSPNVEDQAETFDVFGSALASADFSGDGFHDLAIAARLEDVGAAEDAGGVNVLYGSASGLQTGGPAVPADQFWTQDSPDVEDAAEAFDYFGRALA